MAKRMVRPTKAMWEEARIAREVSRMSFAEIARILGVSSDAVEKRAKREGWSDGVDLIAEVRERAAKMACGLFGNEAADPKEIRDKALSVAAEELAALTKRHREEWEEIGTLRKKVLVEVHADPVTAFERAKLMKITAETTAIKQAGERKAWHMDAPQQQPATAGDIAAILKEIQASGGDVGLK